MTDTTHEHTRKEADAIRSGWSFLHSAAIRHDQEIALNQALKHERKSRSSQIIGKALILQSWLRGWNEPTMPAWRVYGYATGLQLAIMVGADMKVSANLRIDKLALEKIQAGADAHETSMARWFNRK